MDFEYFLASLFIGAIFYYIFKVNNQPIDINVETLKKLKKENFYMAKQVATLKKKLDSVEFSLNTSIEEVNYYQEMLEAEIDKREEMERKFALPAF